MVRIKKKDIAILHTHSKRTVFAKHPKIEFMKKFYCQLILQNDLDQAQKLLGEIYTTETRLLVLGYKLELTI